MQIQFLLTEDVPFSVTIGNQITTTTADITYPAYKEADNNSIGSAFTETVSHVGNVQDPGYYNQVVYVNPMDKDLKGAKLKLKRTIRNIQLILVKLIKMLQI